MTKHNLASHAFPITLLENVRPLVKEAGEALKILAATTGQIRHRGETPLPTNQFYDLEVFRFIATLLGAMDRLEEIQYYIEVFPRPRAFEKKGITQDRWIEYHYAYYIITVTTLLDLSLLLTNSVFRIGHPERLCSFDAIRNNSWVSRTPVKAALQELEKGIKPHKELRNLHVHRGKAPDIAEIMGLDLYDHLKLVSFAQLHSEPIIEQEFIDKLYKMLAEIFSENLEAERETIIKAVSSLFDALFPIYIANARKLQPQQ